SVATAPLLTAYGDLHVKRLKYGDAIDSYMLALQQDPQFQQAYQGLANVYAVTPGRICDALRANDRYVQWLQTYYFPDQQDTDRQDSDQQRRGFLEKQRARCGDRQT